MRILHISTRMILGGSQENTVLSCEGQSRAGHRVHLAFGPIYGPEGSLLSRIEAFNQRVASGEERTASGERCVPIVTHVVPALVRELNIIKDYNAYKQLKQLIGRVMPDVVHTHSSKAGILGRLAAWKVLHDPPGGLTTMFGVNSPNPMRIVHTIHGPPFMPVEGGIVCRTRINVLNNAYVAAEKLCANRCHRIISVADAMTREFLSRGIGGPEQYITVYSGMEVQTFLSALPARRNIRSKLGFSDNHCVVATVARLAEHKGHDDILTALCDDLLSRSDLKLLWIGDGWWRDKLTSRARGMGLQIADLDRDPHGTDTQANILLTGLVDPSRVPELLAASDVLCHPSYREGLPRTVPQALLCNVCPVAYDVDGTGEVCKEMETGRLVPVKNITKLREALLWAIDNPIARAALAQRGKAMCVERFSVESMLSELEAIYKHKPNKTTPIES